MARIRLTQRRNMLNATRERAQAGVVRTILPIMRRQYKHVTNNLRRGGNLRKTMGKIAVPESFRIMMAQDVSFYKAAVIMKVDPFPPFQPPPAMPPQRDESWDSFKAALVASLLLSLGDGAEEIGSVENDVYTSRGYSPLQFDPDLSVQAYQDRIGRKIVNIPEDTMAGVQGAVATWYQNDEPFQGLMDDLGQWFDEGRAELIARQEVGNLMSQITMDAMGFYGFSHLFLAATGET